MIKLYNKKYGTLVDSPSTKLESSSTMIGSTTVWRCFFFDFVLLLVFDRGDYCSFLRIEFSNLQSFNCHSVTVMSSLLRCQVIVIAE